MFIARREDGSIYGAWANRQWKAQEELADTDPEYVAFRDRALPVVEDKLTKLVEKLEQKGVLVKGEVDVKASLSIG